MQLSHFQHFKLFIQKIVLHILTKFITKHLILYQCKFSSINAFGHSVNEKDSFLCSLMNSKGSYSINPPLHILSYFSKL